MPELCAFDDAPAQFPKLFDDDEENSRFQLDEENVAADWFGSFSPSPTNLFGGLNPKQPDAFSNVPVGAVFNWDEKQSDMLSPFGSLYGETDYYNYDVGSNHADQLVESKEKDIKESHIMYTSDSSSNNSSDIPTSFKLKQEKGEVDKIKVKLESKHKTSKKAEGEKRKRGRPRLNTGQESVSPTSADEVDVNLSAHALVERPSSYYDIEDESLVTIGSYTKAVRRAKIERFKAKKQHTLRYGPQLRFAFRRQFAGARPRVGGRFIKMHSDPFLGPPQALVDSDSDMMLSRDELLSDEGNSSAPEGEFFFSDHERDVILAPQANDAFYNDFINQYAAMFTGHPDPRMFIGDQRGALFSGRPDPRMFSGPAFTGPEPPPDFVAFPFGLSNPFPARA
jgi:hypothetical protein